MSWPMPSQTPKKVSSRVKRLPEDIGWSFSCRMVTVDEPIRTKRANSLSLKFFNEITDQVVRATPTRKATSPNYWEISPASRAAAFRNNPAATNHSAPNTIVPITAS